MKVEFIPPKLPRYLPPGYFREWSFWVMVGVNLFGLAWCTTFAYLNAVDQNTIALAIQCACLALNLFNTRYAVNTVLRHSREWRFEDRPKLQKMIDDAARDAQRFANEFAREYSRRHGGQNEN